MHCVLFHSEWKFSVDFMHGHVLFWEVGLSKLFSVVRLPEPDRHVDKIGITIRWSGWPPSPHHFVWTFDDLPTHAISEKSYNYFLLGRRESSSYYTALIKIANVYREAFALVLPWRSTRVNFDTEDSTTLSSSIHSATWLTLFTNGVLVSSITICHRRC